MSIFSIRLDYNNKNMDLPISKIRTITPVRPWIYIMQEQTILTLTEAQSTLPGVSPPLMESSLTSVYTTQQLIDLLCLYLNSVCGLSQTNYYIYTAIGYLNNNNIAVAFKNALGIPQQLPVTSSLIILVVDGGVNLPLCYNGGSSLTLANNNTLPFTLNSGIVPSGYNLITNLLTSTNTVKSFSLNQYPVTDTLHKNGSLLLQGYQSSFVQPFNKLYLQNGSASVPSSANNKPPFNSGCVSYFPINIGAVDYQTCKQYIMVYILQGTQFATVNYCTTQSFENFASLVSLPHQIANDYAETQILALRILHKEFTSIKLLIRENPLLFIKYGVFLLTLYRYVETRNLSI